MNPSNFDELTKALATSPSRRHALKLIITTSIGGLFGLTGINIVFGRHRAETNIPSGPTGNSNCAQFCAAVFGQNSSAAGQCTSDGAHGKGLCHQCPNVQASAICCVRNSSGYCKGTAPATCCASGLHCCNGTCNQCCANSDCTNGNTCGSNHTCVCGSSAACSGSTTCVGGSCCANNKVCGNVCCSSAQNCNSGTCCVATNGHCTSDGDCCSHVCDTTTMTCVTCVMSGDGCSGNSDCCVNNTCLNGTCCPNANVCGSVCGCPSGQHCNNGACVPNCTPNCTGKTCGDDGCGGSCGTCPSGQTCNRLGTCCIANNSACTSDGDCCSNHCDLTTSTCCVPPGDFCSGNNDCCSGNTCVGGVFCCANALVCGSVCFSAPCNTSLCLTCDPSTSSCVSMCSSSQSCVSGSCCDNSGDTCSANSDCCSRLCCNGSCCDSGQTCSNGMCLNPGCFTGGTLIAMADGTSRPIELVQTGDLVLGHGGQINQVLTIHMPLLGNRLLYAFNEGSAFVTSGHPLMTEEGWKSIDPVATATTNPHLGVDKLTVGDRLVSLTGIAVLAGDVPARGEMVDVQIEPVVLESLEGHEAHPGTQLYNLRLDGNQTYFANNLLVHNK